MYFDLPLYLFLNNKSYNNKTSPSHFRINLAKIPKLRSILLNKNRHFIVCIS